MTIVNNTVNDVAATVLPDAPIDPATGLPVPTIAVATDGGVSVIKDDGTVVDITGVLSGSGETAYVFIDAEDNLYFNSRLSGSYLVAFQDIPAANAATSTADAIYGISGSGYAASAPDFLFTVGNMAQISPKAVGGNTGLQPFLTDFSAPASSMVALLTSTYNTGWMNGDIKGAFLSDTDDTDLVGGGELVTNGDFATNDLTGWTDNSTGTGSVDASSGAAEITKIDSSNSGKLSQTITVTSGQTYIVSFDVSDLALNMTIGSWLGLTTTYLVGSYTLTFVANASTMEIAAELAAASGVGTLDNISVKLTDADRSVNNNPHDRDWETKVKV